MKELQRKQRMKRWMYSLPMCLLLFAVAGLLVRGAVGVVGKQVESAKHVKELEVKANALSSRQAELERNIHFLDTEEGIVKEIKEKFSVSGEGEHVVIIVDEASKATSTENERAGWGWEWMDSLRSLWQE